MKSYRRYEWPAFVPHRRWLKSRRYSCGGAALGFVTGVNPNEILKTLPKGANQDWKTRIMLGFLKKMGFGAYRLPAHRSVDGPLKGFSPLISPWLHVVLACVGLNATEKTWCIFWRNRIYHLNNLFDCVTPIEFFLNCPIYEMYILYPYNNEERLGKL